MGYVEGVDRRQPMLLPSRVEDYVAADAQVRVIEAFVGTLDILALGFVRAVPAGIGRPGYDPRDLLRLYLYGYLNGVRSSRRLERECRVNVELMWLMAKRAPDFKTIADFRRDNGAAIIGCCRAFVLTLREAGLLAGNIVAIDGSKLRACASRKQIMNAAEVSAARAEIDAEIAAYLAEMDAQDAAEPDAPAGAQIEATLAALAERRDALASLAETMTREARELGVLGEPDARPMGHGSGAKPPSYNVQIAVDPQSHVVVHHEVTTDANDNRQLLPMACAARDVLAAETLTAVADTGYANASQAAACEAAGIAAAAPSPRCVNRTGAFFAADRFVHDPATDTLTCPAGRRLLRNGAHGRDRALRYRAEDCSGCTLKADCTQTTRRYVYRHVDEAAGRRMNARAERSLMRLRRQTAEHPFASLKRCLGGRFLLRVRTKAATETALAVPAYNLTRAINLLGGQGLIGKLA
ncbi:MAG TPA: IS1182 family transposase [Acidisphaera sp.]|nr:IS1182 family transposase [Acidisphaera sp.]